MDQFPRSDRRPRHAFTGERFDISARITDGEDTITAKVLPPPRQRPGPAKTRPLQSFGDRSPAGPENFPDQILRAARAPARNRIQRGRQMFVRAINPDHSNVPVIPHAHVYAAGENRIRMTSISRGDAHQRSGRDRPFRPWLTGQQRTTDAVAGDDDAGASFDGSAAGSELQSPKRVIGRCGKEERRTAGHKFATAANGLGDDGSVEIAPQHGGSARQRMLESSGRGFPDNAGGRLGAGDRGFDADFAKRVDRRSAQTSAADLFARPCRALDKQNAPAALRQHRSGRTSRHARADDYCIPIVGWTIHPACPSQIRSIRHGQQRWIRAFFNWARAAKPASSRIVHAARTLAGAS